MKLLMAKNQRDYILSHVKSSMLEWGSGGSTLYFLENLQNKKLTSIEHNEEWYKKIKNVIPKNTNHDYILIKGEHVGQNATPYEENPSGLSSYINFNSNEKFDTILVDGVARSSCLMMAYIKYPNATIFLHDANRNWYDHAISLFGQVEIIYPDVNDYPPLLAKLTNKKQTKPIL